MENFDFENNIKQSLENINPMLDNDEIWDNIEPHLKKKKKKRLIFWLFFGVLGLLGLLWLQSGSKSSEKATIKTEIENETTPLTLAQNEINVDEVSIQSETVATTEAKVIDNRQGLQEEIVNEENLITKSQSKLRPSATIEKASPSTKKEEKANAEEIVLKLIAKTSTVSPKMNTSVVSPHKDTSIKELTNQNKESEINIDLIPKVVLDERTNSFETTLLPPAKTESHAEKAEEANKSSNLNNNTEPVIEKKLTKEERAAVNNKRKKERKNSKEKREKKKKEERKKADKEKKAPIKPNKSQKWKYQAQILGSGIYTIQHLKDRNQSESVYLENRSKYVTGTEGFGLELRFATESPNGLILTAGMQYQELREKLIRQEIETKREFENVTETVTEDREGNIIGSTSGMQLVTTTTTYNQQLYNQYRFINFPLGIGYAFKNNKMRLKLIGGIDLNAYYRFSGSMFDSNQNIIELNSKSSSTYKQRFKNTVGLGIWTSVEWHKPLNERLSLIISPAIQAPIGSISPNNEEWPISHNLIKLKLGVGINYILGDIKKSRKRSRKG